MLFKHYLNFNFFQRNDYSDFEKNNFYLGWKFWIVSFIFFLTSFLWFIFLLLIHINFNLCLIIYLFFSINFAFIFLFRTKKFLNKKSFIFFCIYSLILVLSLFIYQNGIQNFINFLNAYSTLLKETKFFFKIQTFNEEFLYKLAFYETSYINLKQKIFISKFFLVNLFFFSKTLFFDLMFYNKNSIIKNNFEIVDLFWFSIDWFSKIKTFDFFFTRKLFEDDLQNFWLKSYILDLNSLFIESSFFFSILWKIYFVKIFFILKWVFLICIILFFYQINLYIISFWKNYLVFIGFFVLWNFFLYNFIINILLLKQILLKSILFSLATIPSFIFILCFFYLNLWNIYKSI